MKVMWKFSSVVNQGELQRQKCVPRQEDSHEYLKKRVHLGVRGAWPGRVAGLSMASLSTSPSSVLSRQFLRRDDRAPAFSSAQVEAFRIA